MIELLSNVGFFLSVGLGLIMFGGVVMIGIYTRQGGADYPGGLKARLWDRFIVLAPLAPSFGLLVWANVLPSVSSSLLGLFGFGISALVGVALCVLLPQCRRANDRLSTFDRARRATEPAQ